MKKVVELFCFVSLRFVLFVAAISLSLDARCMARVFSERWKKKCKGDGRERGRWSAIVRTGSIFLSLGFQPLVFHSVARPCALRASISA